MNVLSFCERIMDCFIFVKKKRKKDTIEYILPHFWANANYALSLVVIFFVDNVFLLYSFT